MQRLRRTRCARDFGATTVNNRRHLLILRTAASNYKLFRFDRQTVEVKSSHVAYISHPKETAKLIEEAATSVYVDELVIAQGH